MAEAYDLVWKQELSLSGGGLSWEEQVFAETACQTKNFSPLDTPPMFKQGLNFQLQTKTKRLSRWLL